MTSAGKLVEASAKKVVEASAKKVVEAMWRLVWGRWGLV